MTEFNDFQRVKRNFFSYRNGVIADTLRRAGSQFKIIFGLNMPQIKEIALSIGINRELSERLWRNSTTRESMILAPMIFPISELTVDLARQFITTAPDREIIDTLCHSLISKNPAICKCLSMEFVDSSSDLMRYASLRMMWSLITMEKEFIRHACQCELDRDCKATRMLAMQLIDELEFLK